MSPEYSRRTILRIGGAVLGGSLAGCTNRFAGAGSPQQKRPSTNSPPVSSQSRSSACDSIELPKPESNTRGGIEPTDYPSFPDSLTEETAGRFAVEFESAYRRNKWVQNHQEGRAPTLRIRTGQEDTFETGDSVVVAVTGFMATDGVQTSIPGTETPEPFPYLDLPFDTWFEVSERRVLRTISDSEFEEPLEPPSFDRAKTVLCP